MSLLLLLRPYLGFLRVYTAHNLAAPLVFTLLILLRARECTAYRFIRYVYDIVRFMAIWLAFSCTVLYWSFVWYDITLLDGRKYQGSLPDNAHLHHTFPLLYTLLLALFHPQADPIPRSHLMFWAIVHVTGYFTFIHSTSHTGFPYPFMNTLSTPAWIEMYCSALLCAVLFAWEYARVDVRAVLLTRKVKAE